jgi:ATP synthase F1 complex assembly factor 2
MSSKVTHFARCIFKNIFHSHIPQQSRCMSTQTLKRFYEDVTIASSNSSFEILLDGKKLKTPSGNILTVHNKSLAIAVATEWDSQTKIIQPSTMHLTALCSTANDNPNRKTKVDLAQDFLQYIESDTLCYRVENPQEMVDLQEKEWDPLLVWFCNVYNVSLTATQSITGEFHDQGDNVRN